MEAFLLEYLPIVIFLAIALALGLVFLFGAAIMAPGEPDPEKVSAYECGFEAFDDSRVKFDVRFYLVAILFMIFDLEVAFLFPWAISLNDIGLTGYWVMMLFLFELVLGFAYAWRKGALEWE